MEEGRSFNFHDESWMNKNMVESREWSDSSLEFNRVVPSGMARGGYLWDAAQKRKDGCMKLIRCGKATLPLWIIMEI